MYSVFSQGLTNFNPSAMWHVFGINLFPSIECPTAPIFNAAGHVTNPCLNATVFGINWGLPEPAITGFYIARLRHQHPRHLVVADASSSPRG